MTVAPTTLDAASIAPPEADELLVIVGPTASGKTALAIDLAERFDAEIIGADSVQIYRGFDLGSGKPTAVEVARARHHMIDIVAPDEAFDAARFAALADACVADLRSRDRTVIVCGGTFLWIKALLRGLAPLPAADAAVRKRHERLVEQQGRPALHAQLAMVDPAAAERLAPNDFVRVSRALEVFELSGKTQTAWHAEHRFQSRRYKARLLGVQRPRELLDERIRTRGQAWLDAGWIDEVRTLLDAGYADTRAMSSVGYRQIREHLAGTISADELLDHIVRATRRFVRRQRTWLRDEPVSWITPPND